MELFFEDIRQGQQFASGRFTLAREELLAFARQYDPQPFHLDEAAADASVFGGLAASGWHTAAITIRLLVEGEPRIAGGIVGRVIEELQWPRPVRPGDILRVESKVLEASPSRSPLRGKVRLLSATLNQLDEVVQSMISLLLVPRRSPSTAADSPPTNPPRP